jgi:hypothetical protein
MEISDFLDGNIEGMDFRINAQFTHATGDKLGVLGAKIENEE